MDSSIVIARAGGAMTFIRSDAMAAQVLQASLREANGGTAPTIDTAQAVLAPPPAAAATSVEAAAPLAATASAEPAAATDTSAGFGQIREKVADFASALDAMKSAVKALGDYMALAIESEDAGAVGYASSMFEQAWAEAFGGGDVIDGSAEEVAPAAIATASGEPTVEEEFMAALDELQEMSYDNEINISADDVNRVMGTQGDDKIEITSTFAERVNAQGGNDSVYIEAKHAYMIGGGKGDDNLVINADVVEDVWDGGGDDTVSITADKATEIEIGKGDDYYDLNVGEASVRLREMGGNDTLNLKDGAHLELMMPTGAMLDDGAASAMWEGDTLMMTFASGDMLKIENAANAGSISIRSGDMSMKLMDGGFVGGEAGAKVLNETV